MAKGKVLNNLLTFTDHSEKYNKPAKKTKRTDVAKDVLENKKTRPVTEKPKSSQRRYPRRAKK